MDARRTTVRDMRRANRAVVLTKLYREGPLSRQELTEVTALSQASVSNMVAELVSDGLVEDAGLVESDGGRPRTLLRVSPSYAYVVGVDIGETRVQVELFDLSMRAIAKADHAFRSASPKPATVVNHTLSGLSEVIKEAGADPNRVLGMGVAVSGVVQHPQEGVVDAQSLGWNSVPLGEMLRVGTSVPVRVDNGAKALGQAEMWFGAGRGARDVVVALIGSGVGAAVVTNSSVYRGSTSSAGEWGHTTIMHGGRRCRCGALGCLEAYVGAESILDRFRQANRGRPVGGGREEPMLATLIASAGSSRTAAKVLEETLDFLGAGLATLVNLLNPERIVLGGWAGLALGERYLPEIRTATGTHALRGPFEHTTIELCELGADAVALGAATLPVAQLLADGGVPR